MAHETLWLDEDRGIQWTFTGIVDTNELKQADAELYNDARLDRVRYSIWDASDVEVFNVQLDDMALFASTDTAASTYMHPVHVAFIAQDENVMQSIRYYIEQSLEFGNQWQMQLFDDIDDARQWLQLNLKEYQLGFKTSQ